MVYYPEKYVIEDYSQSEAMNQSTLKVLARGAAYTKRIEEESDDFLFEEKAHLVLGSLVDTLITCPNLFDSRYYEAPILVKPTEKIISIIEYIVSKSEKLGKLEDMTDLIVESIDKHSFQTNWKQKTRIDKVISDGQEYYDSTLERGNRDIVSISEIAKATTIVESIKTNIYTKHLFEEVAGIDVVYQFPVYFNYDSVPCKGLLDMVIINHHTRTIQPMDIKTMSGITLDFPASVRKRRYDIQAAFYAEGLKECLTELSSLIAKNVIHYKVENFSFLVESTTHTGTPLIYNCTDLMLNIGKWGITIRNSLDTDLGIIDTPTSLPGFKQGLVNYSNRDQIDKRIVDNWGRLPLNYF